MVVHNFIHFINVMECDIAYDQMNDCGISLLTKRSDIQLYHAEVIGLTCFPVSHLSLSLRSCT